MSYIFTEWLHNSFLFHRIQKNSRYYALDKSSDQTWQARLDELVETSLRDLQQNELVVVTENDEYKTTAYGDIMSKVRICIPFVFERDLRITTK